VISERCRSAENVTVRVRGALWSVRTVKPRFGTAEIRHTPPAPKRTVAFPPSDGTVYTPDPPSSHPAVGSRPVAAGRRGAVPRAVGAGAAVVGAGVVRRAVSAVRDGAGPVRSGLGDAPGERDGDWLRAGAGRGAADGSRGADWATGAVGRVEPSTKWMVRTTAVTLAAVQHSQSSR
jgi:hypothetical protein